MHDVPEGQKISRYDTLKQVKKSHKAPLSGWDDAPKLPDAAQSAWGLFSSMGDVSYSELAAYSSVTGVELGQWEIDVIMGLKLIRRARPAWPKEQS